MLHTNHTRKQPELARHTIGLLEVLLGGCQFTPVAFHACIPNLASVIERLQTQYSSVDVGAMDTVLERVVFLVNCMMFAHPGNSFGIPIIPKHSVMTAACQVIQSSTSSPQK